MQENKLMSVILRGSLTDLSTQQLELAESLATA